jgi:hypothetical protein
MDALTYCFLFVCLGLVQFVDEMKRIQDDTATLDGPSLLFCVFVSSKLCRFFARSCSRIGNHRRRDAISHQGTTRTSAQSERRDTRWHRRGSSPAQGESRSRTSLFGPQLLWSVCLRVLQSSFHRVIWLLPVVSCGTGYIEPEDLPELTAELFAKLDLSRQHRISRSSPHLSVG